MSDAEPYTPRFSNGFGADLRDPLCPHGHTLVTESGRRRCRTCHNEQRKQARKARLILAAMDARADVTA